MTTTVAPLRRGLRGSAPGLQVERAWWDIDGGHVVGVDEVGRGAWAGPITVGAAVVPRDRRIYKVRDSKLLTEIERESMFDRVAEWCLDWSIGHASHQECDVLGMSEAQKLAARRALAGLGLAFDCVLVDGNWDFIGHPNTRPIVRGDRTSLTIAAASILAKVTRDRLMRSAAPSFPPYAFDSNKGYPCPTHKAALQAWGPSAVHRRSWVFMDHLPWTGVHRHVRPDDQLTLDLR